MTIVELCRAMGIRTATFYKYRRGKRVPSFAMLFKIITELKMDSQDVVDLMIAMDAKDPELIDAVLAPYLEGLVHGLKRIDWDRWNTETERKRNYQ